MVGFGPADLGSNPSRATFRPSLRVWGASAPHIWVCVFASQCPMKPPVACVAKGLRVWDAKAFESRPFWTFGYKDPKQCVNVLPPMLGGGHTHPRSFAVVPVCLRSPLRGGGGEHTQEEKHMRTKYTHEVVKDACTKRHRDGGTAMVHLKCFLFPCTIFRHTHLLERTGLGTL